MHKIAFVFAVASMCCTSAWSADPVQEFRSNNAQPRILRGNLEHIESVPMRIQRKSTPRLTAQTPVTAPIKPNATLQGLADSFSTSPTPQQPVVAPITPPPVSQPIPAKVEQKDTGYIWQLSRNGNGYYECQNKLPGLTVPGDQLYKYGGVFADGSRVPRRPVVTNSMRHVTRAGTY